jgi:hypothetical protein
MPGMNSGVTSTDFIYSAGYYNYGYSRISSVLPDEIGDNQFPHTAFTALFSLP